MNLSDLSRSIFSAAPVLVSDPATAHSGPELIPALPDPTSGLELAQALLADHIEVNHISTTFASGSSHIPAIFLSLSRR